MIVSRIMGGLGNQMFQYATGRRLGLLNNVPFKLDLSSYRDDTLRTHHQRYNTVDWKDKRTYHLNHFKIIENIIEDEELDRFMQRATKITEINPPNFTEEVLTAKQDTYLLGYWQSERYFEDIRGILQDEFVLKEELDQENKSLLNTIQSVNSVGVHVRRGDYVTDAQTNALHGILPLKYYLTGIEGISGKLKSPHFFIFSDDPEWAAASFEIKYPVTVVDRNKTEYDFVDLFLMKHCKAFIIANSTFSWWAAWLGEYEDKIIYAPEKWFNNPIHNPKDIVPCSWIKV